MANWETVAYSMQEKVKRLEQQLREKEARIARLEQAATLSSSLGVKRFIDNLIAVRKESPQQSLAHIQADAVEPIYKELKSFTAFADCGVVLFPEAQYNNIVKHINNLRGSVDE